MNLLGGGRQQFGATLPVPLSDYISGPRTDRTVHQSMQFVTLVSYFRTQKHAIFCNYLCRRMLYNFRSRNYVCNVALGNCSTHKLYPALQLYTGLLVFDFFHYFIDLLQSAVTTVDVKVCTHVTVI